ncbi:MAG: protein-disulfide reductase DsbD family protein [Rhodovarius sp.]|nr:protein-disulfide reductase DsbD family protein [Rhodovarius sp.]
MRRLPALRLILPLLVLPLLMLPLLVLPPAARAAESAIHTTPRSSASLVSELAAIAPGRPFRVGLDLSLAPGWHSYWRNPGDAGAAPEITWQLPDGARAGPLQFPAPERIPYGPLVNFGYTGRILFPLEVTPPPTLRPGEVFTLIAEASWLVCEQICIPEAARFSLSLPVAAAPEPAPAMAARFALAEAALPRPSPFAARIGFRDRQGVLELTDPTFAPGRIREAFFFPAEAGLLDHAAAQPLGLAAGRLTLTLSRAGAEAPLPAQIEGVIALTDAQGIRSAYALALAPGPMPAPAAAGLPLWQAALLAALGGVILNLMPCVFPVLAMKAMGIARLSGAAAGELRAHALSYSAGVVVSFLAIGAVLYGLRTAGRMAGWGFQFTEPLFVAAMALLMLAVGLNLSGVYRLGGATGTGQALAARGGHAGSFFTGALAVLVATPCTAPFMAAAIGAAMAMPPLAMLAVFGALGVGMALPWLLLALAPAALRLLPRPGPWMERLRQLLAFPMYGAAVWLVWVLAQLAGADAVLAVLAAALLLGFAAWALGTAQAGGARWGRGMAAAGVIGALGLLALLLPASPPAPSAPAEASAGAEVWSEERLAALRAQGRPVFVNMTAAWCITCKVNEQLALQTPSVRAAFAERGITLLVGDWTRGDPAIGAVLRAHGREGVPLYLYYPPGGGGPVMLPQILTEGIVLRAIGAAG